MKTRIFIGLVWLLLLSSTAAGFGMSPGKTRIEFEPGLNGSYTLKVLNQEHSTGKVLLGVGGAIADFISLNVSELEFQKEIEQYTIPFSVALPQELDVGTQLGYIVIARQLGGPGIATTMVLKHRVIVEVPPKYGRVVVEFNATRNMFIVELFNPKAGSVANMGFSLDFNELGTQIFNFSRRGMNLPPRGALTLNILHDILRDGAFTANYTLTYNSSIIQYTLPVVFGAPEPIIRVDASNLSSGKINRLPINISSNWNINLSAKVRATLLSERAGVGQTLSKDFIIPRYGMASPEVFVDATEAGPGRYELSVELLFGKERRALILPVTLKPAVELLVQPPKQGIPWVVWLAVSIVAAMAVIIMLMLRGQKI